MNRVDEIEYMVACNELTEAQVFTQMRQLIPNKNIEAERDALKVTLKECLEILRQNNWRGDLQEQIIEQLEGKGDE